MPQPVIAHALGGRLWRGLVGGTAALTLTAMFGVLVDAGWPVGEALLGAVLAGALLGLGGILVQQRVAQQGSP